MSENLKLYLSGPMSGMSMEDADGWRKGVAQSLKAYAYTILSPTDREKAVFKAKDILIPIPGTPAGSSEIVRRDEFDVRQADVVLVNLEMIYGGDTVRHGVITEESWAYILNKYIILVIEDEGNPNDHPFVREQASVTFKKLGIAVEYLKGFTRKR